MSSSEEPYAVRGRVSRVASDPQPAKRGAYLFRGLELLPSDEAHKTFILFPDTLCGFGRKDLYEFPGLCWEDSEVAARGLLLNNRLPDGTEIYSVTPQSEFVLEPFRPVSVTDAVEAATCLGALDLKNRVAPDEYFWIAKGNLLHTLFGKVLLGRTMGCKLDFEAALDREIHALWEVTTGSAIRLDSRTVTGDILRQCANLDRWAESLLRDVESVTVEEERVSSSYGLKGRLDAVLYRDEGRIACELKTGKNAMREHEDQLFAYSLLLSDPGDEKDSVDGYLLYSSDGRVQRMKRGDAGRILHGRNRALRLKRDYTLEHPEFPSGQPGKSCPRPYTCYSRALCEEYYAAVSRQPESAPASPKLGYYRRWFRAVCQEEWDIETDFARILDPTTLDQRLDENTTLRAKSIKRIGSSVILGDLPCCDEPDGDSEGRPTILEEFTIETLLEEVSEELGVGENLIIHRGDPCAADAIRGRVIGSRPGFAAMRASLPIKLKSDHATGATDDSSNVDRPWLVDRVPFTRNLTASRHALWRFLKEARPEIIDVVIAEPANGPQAVASCETVDPADDSIEVLRSRDDECYREGLLAELNEDQVMAVDSALNSDPFHLVHGPPGTGKTRVLTRLIRKCLDRGERVLVCCPTNVALDRLLLGVVDLAAVDVVRVGVRSRVSRELLGALDRMGRSGALLGELAASGVDPEELRYRLDSAPLIGATAYQCAAHPVFLRTRFDRVVVDEAGQLDEPMTLAALALGDRFVLGGDHMQLPPVVQGRRPDSTGPADLGTSLFERLFESSSDDKISRLRVQYRMNSEVQEITSRLFYNGELTPSPEAARRRLNLDSKLVKPAAFSKILDPERPVVFVDVDGPSGGRVRPEEATVAANLVRKLLSLGTRPDQIGVITPYRAQQSMIKDRLDGADSGFTDSVSVDTVDRFQGGERDVILLSLSRADEVTSFLADRKRLNVSLSRARSKLILLGRGPVLDEHSLFSDILQGLERVAVDYRDIES